MKASTKVLLKFARNMVAYDARQCRDARRDLKAHPKSDFYRAEKSKMEYAYQTSAGVLALAAQSIELKENLENPCGLDKAQA